MSIGQTIADQIGSPAFRMMGARNLVAGERELTFKVGRNGKGVTHVRVTLTDADLYDVTFMRVHGFKVTDKGESLGIYADQLRTTIEGGTGLYLSL